jgi:RecA-family ATPase
MSTYRQGSAEPSLPRVTLEYLEYGAPEGERNAALFNAAQQFRDAGYGLDEAQRQLGARAQLDGLLIGEISTAIASAYRGPQREPIGIGERRTNGSLRKPVPSKIKFRKVETEPEQLPDHLENGWKLLLECAFEPGEYVAIGDTFEDDGRYVPDKGLTFTREDWLEYFSNQKNLRNGVASYGGEHGLFIRVNPVCDGGSKNNDVTAFRHVLVECDRGAKEAQLGAIRKIGLPITAIIDSGGKSVHAWVRIDAKDANEYRDRVETLYAFLEHSLGMSGLDRQNCNPSRYSRLPDARRLQINKETGEPVLDSCGRKIINYQRLLETNVPGKPWSEWFNSLVCADDKELTIDYLLGYNVDEDTNCLIGDNWLKKGQSFILTGEPGHGKSSLVVKLCAEWSIGQAPLGLKPARPLKCLIIQAENDDGDLAEAIQDHLDYLSLGDDDLALIKKNLVFRTCGTRIGENFATYLRQKIDQYRPDLVIADPLLTYAGCEVSRQSEITHFLRELIQPIINETGVILGFVHHNRKPAGQKPDKADESARAMNSMLGSVELAAWPREVISLTCTSEEQKTFKLEFGKRANRTGLGRSITIRHAKDRIGWEEVNGIAGKATGKSNPQKYQQIVNDVSVFIKGRETTHKSEIEALAKHNGYTKADAWTAAQNYARNSNEYQLKKVIGSTVITSDPHYGDIDPDADKKKVRGFIAREKIVSKNKIEQWAERDPALPSGKNAIKMADLMVEEGQLKFTEKFKLPGNNALCKVYSIEDPYSYTWVNGKPMTRQESEKNTDEPVNDPFA